METWSVETEVWKPKYGREKKSCLSVFSALLIHNCVCWGLCSQGVPLYAWVNPCNARARHWALGLDKRHYHEACDCQWLWPGPNKPYSKTINCVYEDKLWEKPNKLQHTEGSNYLYDKKKILYKARQSLRLPITIYHKSIQLQLHT